MKLYRVRWQEVTYCEAYVEAESEEDAIEETQMNSLDDLGGTSMTYFDDNYGHDVDEIAVVETGKAEA